MRIKTLTSKDPGQNVLLNYQHTYDKMYNILSKDTEHGNYAYGYDDLYRLTGVDVDPTNGTNGTNLTNETYTYDAVGNRLTSADITGNWTYNNNNELLTTDNIQYTYDDNGNMVQKTDNGVVANYIYNVEDRLSEVRDGQGSLIAEYYYDPFGRRLWKDVDGTKTYFLYADEGLVGEYDLSGSEIKTYGYAPGSTWTTDPLFMKQGNNYYFYHNDNLGTPQKLTSTNGAVAWAATYTSFGEAIIDASSTMTNNLRFPGQYFDQETGLHYNFHRYYDPKSGRYYTVDPIGLEGGNNFFIYAFQNPCSLIDQLGLKGGFRPQFPRVPAAPVDAPGAGEPPPGTHLPFVGDSFSSLVSYVFEHYPKTYNEFVNRVIELELHESLKIKCREKEMRRLYFRTKHNGVHPLYFAKPGEVLTDAPYVYKEIIGRKDCKCPLGIKKQ